MAYLLGIDLGTSSVKTALFAAENLQVIAAADCEYGVEHPLPGYAEQNPAVWWHAVVQTVRAVMMDHDPGLIKGIGIGGQMHGLVCLGSDGKPVCPAIIWADTRSVVEVEMLASLQLRSAATLPGSPAAGFAAASVLWLSRHQPEVLAQTKTILAPKDYVRFCFTNVLGTDPSDAAASWFYDTAVSAWAVEIVEYCGLKQAQLPKINPSSEIVGVVTPQAAETLGLAVGTPVVSGSADLPAQALGHGIVDPGELLVTIGSGGQVFSPRLTSQPDPAQRYYVFQHNMPHRWYAQAAILCGGLSLRWLRDLLGLAKRPDAYEHLSALATAVPPGADGLLFLPYLVGERSPHMDANATGLFLGLHLNHHAGHMARAVMEGVGFALKECLTLLNVDATQVVLSGGVTRSPVWRQILADTWGMTIQVVPEDVPRACVGTAVLAGIGVGIYVNVGEALANVAEQMIEIHPQNQNLYTAPYAQYRRLYPLLKEEMHQLQAWKRNFIVE